MAEILPKVNCLIRFLSHFLMKNVPYGTFPIDFNVSNLENVPYGTYLRSTISEIVVLLGFGKMLFRAGLVSEAIDQSRNSYFFQNL